MATAVGIAKEKAATISVPFFRPEIGAEERAEVDRVLASGWLTSGPMTQRFEREFATAVGSRHAVAMNSCTAALHLAVEALGLKAGDAVLVPTMTFAATAEIVRYQGAFPVLVDCEPETCNIDLTDAERKVRALTKGSLPGIPAATPLKGIIPVHVGGWMCEMDELSDFASRHGLWIVEDAAHAFPAAWRKQTADDWRRCGEATADVTCFSFYANKTITTGEGGMAVCESEEIADRLRLMSLHGLSRNAWGRYTGSGSWDYRIIAPGFKYNMPDPLAAIGVHQLAKAEMFRQQREQIALRYLEELADLDEIMLPVSGALTNPIVAFVRDSTSARANFHQPRGVHRRIEAGRREHLCALETAASSSLLRGKFRLDGRGLPRGIARMAVESESAAVSGYEDRRDRSRDLNRAKGMQGA